jgi:ankyrin repeat protein
MVGLLARLLPFYGTGDFNSDALVIDTIHRLPPHALEMQDQNGTTLLLLVCQFAAYDLLPTLLNKGCDVNASNNVGATPLHYACFSDTFSAESAMTLVRHGANVEVVETDWGCTPLHWAAFNGHVELCRVLCIAGASPMTRDKCGNDPISYSRQSGNSTCTALLESFCIDGKGGGNNLRWDRMIDGNTGSSFYYNKDTGGVVHIHYM